MDRRRGQVRDFEERASLRQALANWRRLRSAYWRMLAKAHIEGNPVRLASVEAKLSDCDRELSRLSQLVHH